MLDVIRHGYMKVTDFNLIIFDECHHGRNDHPMHQLMSYFNGYPKTELPRVIGLTGSLTSASVKEQNIVDDLLALEATYRSTIATVKGMGELQNVLIYSTRPKESMEQFQTYIKPQTMDNILSQINEMLKGLDDWPIDTSHEKQHIIDHSKQRPSPVKKLGKLLKDFCYHCNDLGK